MGKTKKLNNSEPLLNGYKFPVAGAIYQERFNSLEKKIKNILCFSHLRWDFVYQRPQHLLSRFGKESRVFFIEEPVFGNISRNHLRIKENDEDIIIAVPQVQQEISNEELNKFLIKSINELISEYNIQDYLSWYLTPMAIPFTVHLDPELIVYDCMDELSNFKGAHPDMLKNEAVLMRLADVVFTGGHSLYEFKKNKHPNIHPMPSSIDREHFSQLKEEPCDQRKIPGPIVGFFGVIDERLDIELLSGVAKKNPDVSFVMIGPVVKIDRNMLPQYPNIYYLGKKKYEDLPAYLSNWNVAILPFAKNESTRFISPTKTPEYLCAGKRVVSTSIRDVVKPYGEKGLVYIADSINDFSKALRKAIKKRNNGFWRKKVEKELSSNSWDITWMKMKKIILETLLVKKDLKEAGLQTLNAQVG